MKDCYKSVHKVDICGTLDYDNNDNKVIIVNLKDEEQKIISFDKLVESLMGHQIEIKTEDDYSE